MNPVPAAALALCLSGCATAPTEDPRRPPFGLDSQIRFTLEVDGEIHVRTSEYVTRDHWLASDGGRGCADTWAWWLRGGGIFTSFYLPAEWEPGQRYVDGEGITLNREVAFLYDLTDEDAQRVIGSVDSLEVVAWGDVEIIELGGVTWCATVWDETADDDCSETSDTVRITLDTNDGTRLPAYVMRCHQALGPMEEAAVDGIPLCESDAAASWGSCP